jgi:succinate dehydrogenase / fumarate reductase iron-sulfur subunit
MDAVHWAKIQRVTPWLVNKQPIPEREYVVPHENMVDVTQSMACIQCGACVSDCLSMEVDPLFIGPAALAKSYRFVGDPRDAQQFERVKDLAEDPHGIYDCTHCFKCIEACPKGVAPMNQIMRLRRVANRDHHIVDRNNGARHEKAFTSLVRDHGLLWEAELLPRSYGGDSWFGKFAPTAGLELADSLPVIAKALLRRKVTVGKSLRPPSEMPKDAKRAVRRIYDKVEGRDEQNVLNLYITGYDDEPTGGGTDEHQATVQAGATGDGGGSGAEAGTPGLSPERSPSR